MGLSKLIDELEEMLEVRSDEKDQLKHQAGKHPQISHGGGRGGGGTKGQITSAVALDKEMGSGKKTWDEAMRTLGKVNVSGDTRGVRDGVGKVLGKLGFDYSNSYMNTKTGASTDLYTRGLKGGQSVSAEITSKKGKTTVKYLGKD